MEGLLYSLRQATGDSKKRKKKKEKKKEVELMSWIFKHNSVAVKKKERNLNSVASGKLCIVSM